MNLSSVRRYTIIEHGLQIVLGYRNMGVRRRKSSCFVVFWWWWWCLGFSKYHQELAESFKEPIAKGFKSGGWVGKSCCRLFFIMPTTQAADIHNLTQTWRAALVGLENAEKGPHLIDTVPLIPGTKTNTNTTIIVYPSQCPKDFSVLQKKIKF